MGSMEYKIERFLKCLPALKSQELSADWRPYTKALLLCELCLRRNEFQSTV